MNVLTVTTAFCCLIFCVFLAIVFFSKRNMNNIETKIYKYIIIFDFIMIIFHIVALYTGYYVNKVPHMLLIYDISSRIFGFANYIWCGLLEVYTLLMISNNENDLIHTIFYKKDPKKTKIFTIIIALTFVLGCFLPFEFYYVNGVIAYTGPCLFYYMGLLVIFILITIGYIIKYFKTIDSYWKLSPIIFFAIMQILNLFANLFDGTLNEVPLALTLTSYFMYHVIENPDIKLITELKFAKEQAEKAENAKGDFLNSVSQEMVQPLTSLVQLSETIQDAKDIDEVHKNTQEIVDVSQGILELVNGILDINRLEAGKIEIIEKEYNPREEFTEIAKKISMSIGKKPVTLETKFSENLPEKLFGDDEKIKRIISNLLTNSVKYTDIGHITFNVECENEKGYSNLTISIRDTGRGINDEIKEKLNKEDYTSSTNVQDAGTGLGLSLVKSLVEILDGKITMKSLENVGTTFTINIKQKIKD